jgi:asparagine synthase (glutamine-hydrolysing)
MSKTVSPESAAPRKQGFSSPDASWFKVQSRSFIEGSLFRKGAPLAQYLDCRVVRELVSEHFEGTRNRWLLVWSLLSLNTYLEQNGG